MAMTIGRVSSWVRVLTPPLPSSKAEERNSEPMKELNAGSLIATQLVGLMTTDLKSIDSTRNKTQV